MSNQLFFLKNKYALSVFEVMTIKIEIPPEKLAAAIQKCFMQTAIRIVLAEKEAKK
jgi:hypothetical protein